MYNKDRVLGVSDDPGVGFRGLDDREEWGEGSLGLSPGTRRHVGVSDDGHTIGGGVDLSAETRVIPHQTPNSPRKNTSFLNFGDFQDSKKEAVRYIYIYIYIYIP